VRRGHNRDFEIECLAVLVLEVFRWFNGIP
jgi:hypothetical protein